MDEGRALLTQSGDEDLVSFPARVFTTPFHLDDMRALGVAFLSDILNDQKSLASSSVSLEVKVLLVL